MCLCVSTLLPCVMINIPQSLHRAPSGTHGRHKRKNGDCLYGSSSAGHHRHVWRKWRSTSGARGRTPPVMGEGRQPPSTAAMDSILVG